MNIDEQVATFEQAKKLKGLGMPQECYFVWIDLPGEEPYQSIAYMIAEDSDLVQYAAPTVSETIELCQGTEWFFPMYVPGMRKWMHKFRPAGWFGSMAEACADMLIILAKTQLITFPKIIIFLPTQNSPTDADSELHDQS